MNELNWDKVLSSSGDVEFIVEKQQMNWIIGELGNKIDKDGFVIDAKNEKRVISQDEGEVKLNDLGSISAASKHFIKKNVASYAEFLSQKRN